MSPTNCFGSSSYISFYRSVRGLSVFESTIFLNSNRYTLSSNLDDSGKLIDFTEFRFSEVFMESNDMRLSGNVRISLIFTDTNELSVSVNLSTRNAEVTETTSSIVHVEASRISEIDENSQKVDGLSSVMSQVWVSPLPTRKNEGSSEHLSFLSIIDTRETSTYLFLETSLQENEISSSLSSFESFSRSLLSSSDSKAKAYSS
jgi:hypothetical protein